MRNHFENTQKNVPTNYLKYIWDLPAFVAMHLVRLHLKMYTQGLPFKAPMMIMKRKQLQVPVQYVIFFDFLNRFGCTMSFVTSTTFSAQRRKPKKCIKKLVRT
jgi:hypothetical protein